MANHLSEQLALGLPTAHGLYDPAMEKDGCGVGFVCHIKGVPSHDIITDALAMNCCMEHRGGVGYEANSGDGAGIITALPYEFLERVARADLGVELPARGRYGAGIVFLPRDIDERSHCKRVFEAQISAAGQQLLGWRVLPVAPDEANIGKAARRAMPYMEQLFVGAGDAPDEAFSTAAFERKLYVIRKHATHLCRGDRNLHERKLFYVSSLSSKTIVYKGMLTPDQLGVFFVDLGADDYASHMAMIHSRFSTNTFPSWDRAQPNRFMSHNGEINTLLGNKNSMNAREGVVASALYGNDLKKLFPIVEPDCSDSGTFDNVLEFLTQSGRSLPESVMMMIPEAWQQDKNMSAEKRALYEFNSCLMEPWDGPASIAFTDGSTIGAVLDRNGLRPSRYYITDDDRCIMASEVGTIPIDPARVVEKGRLRPGRVFLIDFEQGRMIPDRELKTRWAAQHPYAAWLAEQRLELSDLRASEEYQGFEPRTVLQRSLAFGYTIETMHFMLEPMIKEGRDPLGSMGNDAALAVMSSMPRMIYDYFKQLFAQVTNPPIDSIREEVIMALECYAGPEGNLLDPIAKSAHRLRVPHPVLTNQEFAALKHMDHRGWRTRTIDITFAAGSGERGLIRALDRICDEATAAIAQGYSLIVLSDRDISATRVPVSALLATGAVHHHLVRTLERTRVGILVETGEAREIHQLCLLVGYGADAINPYLAFEMLWRARREGRFDDTQRIKSDDDIVTTYRKATAKGILKIMAKMGISTLQSYKGAQIFEAVGIAEEVVERCFTGTASRVSGVGFAVLAEEMERRHGLAFPARPLNQALVLPNNGDFHWRQGGDRHMWDPQAIAALQTAARTNTEAAYWQFADHVNTTATRLATLRGLLRFREDPSQPAVPLDEVDAEADIVKRFATGAMSFGSISREAHETLAIAMNRIGGKSNTGEGGEDAARFARLPNGDSKRSAIKQVASGRFGVTINYLTNADELQIKIVQGAKPGEGGELPGHKVDDFIASIRHSTPGVGLISPPPHHDIYSIEDIAQLIHDLKNANPAARISVKLGSEIGVGQVAAGVVKARADHLVIAGDTGGTGASPLTSIKHAGLPWELGIAEAHQTLVRNNLRSRVTLQTDGQIKTGRDVAIAILLGAEEIGFATAPLVSLGCIMMRKCHLNTCPVGIATQDPELRKKFTGQPEHVVNYLFMVARELRGIMAKLGFRTINEMVGRADCLEVDDAVRHWKATGIDLSRLLMKAPEPEEFLGSHRIHGQDHGLEKSLDKELIRLAQPVLGQGARGKGAKVRATLPIVNTNRVVGGTLSHEIIKRYGADMLPDDTIHFKFTGSAGQSFGAWLAKGVTLELEGDANDYVGKGLSGGRVIIYPDARSRFRAEENILVGNVVLYGATSGECYLRGVAAERFAVRNSGARAVIEGVGDHGCEYMTGGRVVVLGETGRNFAAGMSGGVAYVWNPHGTFDARVNSEMVELERMDDPADCAELRQLIERHAAYTRSDVATRILADWSRTCAQFVKVMPIDYKRVLMGMSARDEAA